jgi:hypothetical protein
MYYGQLMPKLIAVTSLATVSIVDKNAYCSQLMQAVCLYGIDTRKDTFVLENARKAVNR